jgi:exopolyphosphatase/guanosine-5'-triphosphate,3'-diphosphate pyrophosphatase
MKSVTSIDLGSNSFRVLKIDCKTKATLGEYEQTVGTADGLSKTGNISKQALQRVVDAVKKSIQVVDYVPQEAVAVTTHALRAAKNSKEVIADIQERTGVVFNIIDGKKEASLTLLAMQYALKREKLPDDKFILLDIGGGSTELIIFDNGESFIKSFSYGIVTLSQSEDKEKDFSIFKKEVELFLSDCGLETASYGFLSTAGTPTTVAALKHGLNYQTYDKTIVNGTTLTLDEVKQIQKKLNSYSKEELVFNVGTGREDYIDTGMSIYELFFEVLKKQTSIVFDDGLREGVAIDYCINNQ